MYEGDTKPICKGNTKPELQNLLDEDLHGASRVPVLIFSPYVYYPNKTLESLTFGSYEVLPCEPVHDIVHPVDGNPLL